MEFHKYLDQPTQFEGQYNIIRKNEGRILTTEQIRELPHTSKDYPHHNEWNKRIPSTQRFLKYLAKNRVASVLDVGCGNGWLLYKMAPLVSRLTGLDINKLELEQAASVLHEFENVQLLYGDIFEIEAKPTYDLILFNASIQYFPHLPALLKRAKSFLSTNGEIHILDSPFYDNVKEAQKASKRTHEYYEKNGVKSMADFYHHHTFQDLEEFDSQVLYNPASLIQRLKRKLVTDIPLYWIVIKFN